MLFTNRHRRLVLVADSRIDGQLLGGFPVILKKSDVVSFAAGFGHRQLVAAVLILPRRKSQSPVGVARGALVRDEPSKASSLQDGGGLKE